MGRFISTKEAADYAGMSTSTLLAWISRGKIKPDGGLEKGHRFWMTDHGYVPVMDCALGIERDKVPNASSAGPDTEASNSDNTKEQTNKEEGGHGRVVAFRRPMANPSDGQKGRSCSPGHILHTAEFHEPGPSGGPPSGYNNQSPPSRPRRSRYRASAHVPDFRTLLD